MPAKKSSPKRSSPRRSPVRKVVREAEYVINEVDAEPSREIFKFMNMFGYLFVILALAAGIAWIYYVEVAVRNKDIGGNEGGENGDAAFETATVMFEGAVVATLLYFVSRHHYHSLHN